MIAKRLEFTLASVPEGTVTQAENVLTLRAEANQVHHGVTLRFEGAAGDWSDSRCLSFSLRAGKTAPYSYPGERP